MADINETMQYDEGIYQIEQSDFVIGGAGNIANRQAEQLANRTAWLRQLIAVVDLNNANTSMLFGQAAKQLEELNNVAILPFIIELISTTLGQVAKQINGGEIALNGGSIADPALKIGSASIYSSANDTLSIAIGGNEILRITASGITVYGTVTEA